MPIAPAIVIPRPNSDPVRSHALLSKMWLRVIVAPTPGSTYMPTQLSWTRLLVTSAPVVATQMPMSWPAMSLP